MKRKTNLEVEIKLPLRGSMAAFRRKLRALGFEIRKPRAFESNLLFDAPDLRLRRARELIRVRRLAGNAVLTYKGPSQPGKHKKREELETEVGDAGVIGAILGRLGLMPVYRYEKYRAEYKKAGAAGILTLDETPIGNFIELEGSPAWIDRTARLLGYSESDYITVSYGTLYESYCRQRGLQPADMVFKASAAGSK